MREQEAFPELAGLPEDLLKSRVEVDLARLSRLETQSAIARSRKVLAEIRALLIALQYMSRQHRDADDDGALAV